MANAKELPEDRYLHECFTLVGNTLVWRSRPSHHFKSLRGMRSFNTQFAGKVAGSQSGRYAVVRIGKDHFKQHRVIMKMRGAAINSGYLVDHVNGDTFDNSDLNLRLTGHAGNMQNMKKCVTNKVGMSGLYVLNNQDGTSFVRFQWREQGKRKNKSFSIKRYGYEVALTLAEAFRSTTLHRLNLEGASYTARHGV